MICWQVNRRGKLVQVCDPQCAAVPSHLCTYDAAEAQLLLADCGSHQVVVLDSQLAVVRVFLDQRRDGVTRPLRVVKSGYFLVAHSNSAAADDRSGVVSLYWPQKSTLQPLPD